MMTIPKLILPILMITAVLGAVLVGQATGTWEVSGKTMIDVNNLASADDIKGWMTIQQVSTGLNIDPPTLYAVTGISTDIAPETALKDLEAIVEGFEITAVREKVTAYLETGEILAAQESPAPSESAPVATATSAQAPVLVETPHAPLQSNEDTGDGTGPTPLPPDAYLAAADIKGRTTLNEIILNGQVDQAELLTALGLPLDADLNKAAKDLVGQGNVIEIQTIRDVVAELQQK